MADAARYQHNLSAFPKFEDVKSVGEVYRQEIDYVRGKLANVEGASKLSDIVIYRFVKGWKFDLERATTELAGMIRWRAEYKMDAIKEKVVTMHPSAFPHADKLVKCFPKNSHHGVDKSGQPISILRLGMVKLESLSRLVTPEELKEWFRYDIEKEATTLEEFTRKTGKLTRKCEIYDLNGLGMAHLSTQAYSILKDIVTAGTGNYPESLGNMYIINAPWAFNVAWRTVKPWLKESTQAKIQILGADYQAVLKEAIDAKNLPVWLGGECTCEDKGGCVPQVDEDEGLEEVEVKAGSDHVVTLEVTETDVVSWAYRVRAKDIVFKVSFTESVTKQRVPKKEEKHEATHGLTSGEFIASKAGQLTFAWDNSYSRWTKKSLLYSIQKGSQAETNTK